LIVRGQANLLEDVTALADLERLRALFEMLETKATVLRLLDASRQADGVQIFIGAESHLFGVAGCSLIIAPYQNSREQIVGAKCLGHGEHFARHLRPLPIAPLLGVDVHDLPERREVCGREHRPRPELCLHRHVHGLGDQDVARARLAAVG
jgi:hypothetical protein